MEKFYIIDLYAYLRYWIVGMGKATIFQTFSFSSPPLASPSQLLDYIMKMNNPSDLMRDSWSCK
jgi:hypothetical protein